MKKLILISLLLGIVSLTNAALLISADGVVDPPDSEVVLVMNEWAVIGIYSDRVQPGDGFFLLVEGPASYDLSQAVNYAKPDGIYDLALVGYPGMILLDIAIMYSTGPIMPKGTVVGNIMLHCDGEGDVLLTLSNAVTGEIMDTQVIHQVPEPGTMALLGLGGMMLRKKGKGKGEKGTRA